MGLLVALLYLPVIGHDFVNIDDAVYVTENPVVRRGLSTSSVAWAFTTMHGANWHPLTWVSHLADVSLYGLRPGGHHLTNLLLHGAATVILFMVMRRLFGHIGRSFLVAALFGIHPLHVESVAWISERKDVLSAVLGFLAIGAYAVYLRRPGAVRYALVASLFALGLLAKPMLVTLPLLLLILDWWPLGRLGNVSVRRLVLEKIPLLFLSAVSSAMTLIAQSRGGALADRELFPIGARLQNALIACATYLGKAILPTHLTVYYLHPGTSIPLAKALTALVFLTILTAAALRRCSRRDKPYLLAGWLWYLVSLLPVIGLIQVGGQAMADRYTYIPLLGPFAALAWGGGDFARRRGRRLAGLAPVAAAATLLALGVLTARQVRVWRDSSTLFRHALAIDPRSWWAHNNLGNIDAQRGDHAKAMEHYRRALEIRPDYAQARYNLGLSLGAQGRLAEAVAEYREALRLAPDNAEARNNLGSVLALMGNARAAEAEYRIAILTRPGEISALVNLAGLLLEQGDERGAEGLYREAVDLDPGSAPAHYNLGALLVKRRDFAGAAAEFREAVRRDSQYAEAHNNLGAALVALGRAQEALGHFQEALRLKPGYPSAIANLERYRARYGLPDRNTGR